MAFKDWEPPAKATVIAGIVVGVLALAGTIITVAPNYLGGGGPSPTPSPTSVVSPSVPSRSPSSPSVPETTCSASLLTKPWRLESAFVVSLAGYGTNGFDGSQMIDIPLRAFVSLPDAPSNSPGGEHLDLTKPLLPPISARFWHSGHFVVDITALRLCSVH